MKSSPSKYLYKLSLLSELLSKSYAIELSKTLGVPFEQLINSKLVQKYYQNLRFKLDELSDKWEKSYNKYRKYNIKWK